MLARLKNGEDDREALLHSVASLYTLGHEIDWRAIHPTGRLVRLPRYPWQRERFWLDSPAEPERRNGPVGLGLHTCGNGHGKTHENGNGHATYVNGFAECGDPSGSDVGHFLHELHWRLLERRIVADHDASGGPWLILADPNGIGARVRAQLQALGADSLVVPFADLEVEQFQSLLSQLAPIAGSSTFGASTQPGRGT